MTARCRVDLEDTTGNVVAIFENFRSLSFETLASERGNYRLTLSGFDDRINLFGDDYLLRFWFQDLSQNIDWLNVFNGIHKTFTRGMSLNGQRTFISFGPSLEEILGKAEILYPSGVTTRARKSGTASTVMYSYVIQNVGIDALAASGRDIDHVNPIVNYPDLAIGPSWTGMRSRKNLLNVLQEIRDYSIQQNNQIDFRINYLGNYQFQFEVYQATDRTANGVSALSNGLNGAGNVPVVFGPNFRNVQQYTRSKSRFNEANVVVALGQGSDRNRQKGIKTNSLSISSSPIAQREITINASNEDNVADLEIRAASKLQEKIADDKFSYEPGIGGQILWRDYFPSDFVTGEDEDGARFNQQITGVSVNVQSVESGDQVIRNNIKFSDK